MIVHTKLTFAEVIAESETVDTLFWSCVGLTPLAVTQFDPRDVGILDLARASNKPFILVLDPAYASVGHAMEMQQEMPRLLNQDCLVIVMDGELDEVDASAFRRFLYGVTHPEDRRTVWDKLVEN